MSCVHKVNQSLVLSTHKNKPELLLILNTFQPCLDKNPKLTLYLKRKHIIINIIWLKRENSNFQHVEPITYYEPLIKQTHSMFSLIYFSFIFIHNIFVICRYTTINNNKNKKHNYVVCTRTLRLLSREQMDTQNESETWNENKKKINRSTSHIPQTKTWAAKYKAQAHTKVLGAVAVSAAVTFLFYFSFVWFDFDERIGMY